MEGLWRSCRAFLGCGPAGAGEVSLPAASLMDRVRLHRSPLMRAAKGHGHGWLTPPPLLHMAKEDALGWMLVCVHMWVWLCEFKVITPSGLSHSGWGEAAYPDFLTHYHITSLCHPFFPLTFLSLPSLSLSTCYRLKGPIRLLKWPSPWWIETVHTNFPQTFCLHLSFPFTYSANSPVRAAWKQMKGSGT